MLKQLFCWAYSSWLSKFVDKKSDPLVRFIDLLESSCKYCLVIRWMMAASGITLALCGYWIGLMLPIGAYLMTIGEKHWLCDIPKE